MNRQRNCFPPKSLLKKRSLCSISEEETKAAAATIQQTLFNFGAGVRISHIYTGARFTRYEIIPESGVRVKEIAEREKELQAATAASSIHIEKSIPGRFAMGIDVANKESSIIGIKEIIESADFTEFPSDAAGILGKNAIGETVIADLAEMPHLLIAGTGGSGKTVFLSSFLTGVLYKASPDAVKMILIDTKDTNLNLFTEIPHLLAPPINNRSKALKALSWVISEIQDRYQKFVDCGVRDLDGYNLSEKTSGRLPRIFVVIADLFDLMSMYKKETEQLLVRITQTARKAGIHLILATQKLSEEILTPEIKANIPGRIAFRVSSAADSEAILDEKGAEKLLGNGDLLFKSLGRTRPVRIQGAYVSEEEVLKVVDFLKNHSGETLLNEEEFLLDYDSMDGWQFENFCADILRANGYKNVEVTKGSGDQGVDVFAERDGIRYAVQCKRYSQPVGNKAIQEIFAGKQFYHCHVGIVMTSNYFTKSAKELAKENGIILWDRDFLSKFTRDNKEKAVYPA